MKNIFKGLGLVLMALFLVVGIGAGTANAALTLEALAITSDGALALNSTDWDISATGVVTGVGAVTMDGTLTLANGETIGNAVDNVVAVTSPSTTFSGDITITGDDLVMGTNTSGAVLVADGTNFNPAVMSGDATIGTTGVLAIASNAVQGTDISLASEVAGDIMYSNGTDWVRLAKGTALQVLRTNAGATAPEWATMVAALDNASAWTASQAFDAGITVDTTNFTVSGTTGAIHTAGDFDVATNKLAVAAATGTMTLANGETIANSTDGIITMTGQVLVNPTRVADAYAYGFNISSGELFFTGGAAQKSYLLNISGDRPLASAATGDSNDSGIKVALNNYAANDSNFILRGVNSGINNRSGGTLGILEGASIGAQNKSGGTSPTVRGLTVTPENYGTTATEFGGIDVVLKNEGAQATTSYGIRVRSTEASGMVAIGAGYLLSNTSTNGFSYGLDMNGTTIGTADIRLSNGEIISNGTDGTISFGAANLTTTGALIMPASAETLVDGADGGTSCAAGNKGAVVIDVANKFYGCDGTDWQVLDN